MSVLKRLPQHGVVVDGIASFELCKCASSRASCHPSPRQWCDNSRCASVHPAQFWCHSSFDLHTTQPHGYSGAPRALGSLQRTSVRSVSPAPPLDSGTHLPMQVQESSGGHLEAVACGSGHRAVDCEVGFAAGVQECYQSKRSRASPPPAKRRRRRARKSELSDDERVMLKRHCEIRDVVVTSAQALLLDCPLQELLSRPQVSDEKQDGEVEVRVVDFPAICRQSKTAGIRKPFLLTSTVRTPVDVSPDALVNALVTCGNSGPSSSIQSNQDDTARDVSQHNMAEQESPCVYINVEGAKYAIPKHSRFLCSDISTCSTLFRQELRGETFDLIVMDPPWQNKSVARGGGRYDTLSTDALDQLPVSRVCRPGTLVAIWCTNKTRHLSTLKSELLRAWGLQFVAEWYWLKMCPDGLHPVIDMDSKHKRPYEPLILARCVGSSNESIASPPIPSHHVIVSVPSAGHSRKPPLGAYVIFISSTSVLWLCYLCWNSNKNGTCFCVVHKIYQDARCVNCFVRACVVCTRTVAGIFKRLSKKTP
eukprot:m.228094 g.228094  ORF g.228094 m.228094 type:complete len:536 (+) comp19250_c1_seq20:124-1731(+)